MATLAMAWALSVLLRRSLLNGGSENWALLAVGLAVFARSMTEASLFSAFIRLDMILWTGALIIGTSALRNPQSSAIK